MEPQTLRCSKCKKNKHEDAYHVDNKRKTGRGAYCKTCLADYIRATNDERKSKLRKLTVEVASLRKQLEQQATKHDIALHKKDVQIAKLSQELLSLYRKVNK